MLEFRYRSSDEFEKSLVSYVRSLDPRATVDFNYHGNPPFSFEVGQRPVQHASNGDFITGETGVWGFSALSVGLNAEFYRAAAPQRRVQVAMQRGVRMYHDQTTRPLNDLRWELLTLLAHGAFVTMVDKTGFDGSLDPVAYERVGEVFAQAQAAREQFGHEPVADVGIYFSSRSRDWLGREKPAEWLLSFLGAHKTLVHEHIPWGVVLDENATLEVLERFPVLLLPNVGIVSEREAALFRRYVEGGGKLILTGCPGCFDSMGRPASENPLAPLIGGKFVRKLDSLDNWMRIDATQEGDESKRALNVRRDWPFLVKGPAAVWKAESATPCGVLMKPFRTSRQQEGKEGVEWPMSADVDVGPALLHNRIGAGEVLTFAGSPDYSTASEHHIVEARRLLASAVHSLHPAPRVRIKAPANVESIITDDPKSRTLRVHLLAYNALPQSLPLKERPYVLPGLIEDPPMYRASIEILHGMQGVTALNPSTQLTQRDNRVELIVEDIYEVLQFRY